MLTQYHRWVHDHGKEESVLTLQEFISLEYKFQTIALETIKGITSSKESHTKSYHTNLICPTCDGNHDLHMCAKFMELSIDERWDLAKQKKLCYKCLKRNHRGYECKSNQNVCSDEKCKMKHHEKLHQSTKDRVNVGHIGGNTCNHITISMRTIPVVVHYEGK